MPLPSPFAEDLEAIRTGNTPLQRMNAKMKDDLAATAGDNSETRERQQERERVANILANPSKYFEQTLYREIHEEGKRFDELSERLEAKNRRPSAGLTLSGTTDARRHGRDAKPLRSLPSRWQPYRSRAISDPLDAFDTLRSAPRLSIEQKDGTYTLEPQPLSTQEVPSTAYSDHRSILPPPRSTSSKITSMHVKVHVPRQGDFKDKTSWQSVREQLAGILSAKLLEEVGDRGYIKTVRERSAINTDYCIVTTACARKLIAATRALPRTSCETCVSKGRPCAVFLDHGTAIGFFPIADSIGETGPNDLSRYIRDRPRG